MFHCSYYVHNYHQYFHICIFSHHGKQNGNSKRWWTFPYVIATYANECMILHVFFMLIYHLGSAVHQIICVDVVLSVYDHVWQIVRIGCGCQKSSFRYNFCIIVNIKKLYGYPKMLKKCVIIFYPLIKMATWLYVYVILCEFSHHLHQLLCYHCVNFCVIMCGW